MRLRGKLHIFFAFLNGQIIGKAGMAHGGFAPQCIGKFRRMEKSSPQQQKYQKCKKGIK